MIQVTRFPSGGTNHKGIILPVEYLCDDSYRPAIRPIKQGVVWQDLMNGLRHVTQDNGAKLANVTPATLPEMVTIKTVLKASHLIRLRLISQQLDIKGTMSPICLDKRTMGKTWTK